MTTENEHHAALLSVLSRHLPALIAQLVLERGLARARLRPAELSSANVPGLVEHLEKVARLFADKTKLPQLITDLRGGKERPAPQVVTTVVEIGAELDISRARVTAKQMCMQLGSMGLTAQKVATVVSELARNIVDYTPGGRIELQPFVGPPARVVIRASDEGAGIPNLPQIMRGEYKSRTGLGVGLRGSKQLVDRFEIDSGAQGTRIEAEVKL